MFCAVNAAAVILVPGGETIPFHFVWVSFSIVYALRVWRVRGTLLALLVVTVGSGLALGWAVAHTAAGLDETAEVPLMAAMFLAMMVHVERRQAAAREVEEVSGRALQLVRERDLVRDASHELRTPITVARGHAELIRTNYVGRQAAADAEVILDELNRLVRISDRLLLLAAAESPGFLRRASFDLERVVVDAVRRWSVTAARAWRADVTLDGTIDADEERLEAALDVLIENAIKFTSDGQVIRVTAYVEAADAVIEVADEGIGIPPDQLDRIFDRFARADGAQSGEARGTGLGLSIAQSIAKAHGGAIAVESTFGQGSTFRLRLPRFRPAPLAGRGAEPPTAAREPAAVGGD